MVEIQRIKMHVAFLLKNVPRVIDKKETTMKNMNHICKISILQKQIDVLHLVSMFLLK